MNKILQTLPMETQNEIKEMLKSYNEATVVFQNGNYEVRTGILILNEYPSDYKMIGDFTKDDVFNEIEQIENYINEFKDYPSNYKGKKDFELMEKMENDIKYDFANNVKYEWVGNIDKDGDFALKEKTAKSF